MEALKPEDIRAMKMGVDRFLRTFWRGFVELWLGIEIGN